MKNLWAPSTKLDPTALHSATMAGIVAATAPPKKDGNVFLGYPLVNVYIVMENPPIFNG